MDYYNISDDYLDEDDDGIMYSTKNYRSDSDDDDISAFLQYKPKKKGKFLESSDKKNGLNTQDDFEKEMAAELHATMKRLTAPSSSSQSGSEDNTEKEETHYNKIYFDSDEEEEESSSDVRKDKHKVLTNDELLYDPLMDDADQAWVDNNRRSYQVRSKRTKNGSEPFKPQALPQSDAVLNCPACFTTLCLDCQRHEIYKNQYRAMFVFNCVVDKSERLHFALKEDKKKKFKSKKRKSSSENTSIAELCNNDPSTSSNNGPDKNDGTVNNDGTEDTFNPVKCAMCNTKVAVQDETEVYHFFNVLTSY